MAECPVCGLEFTLSPDTEEGEIISCEDCGSELEVTGRIVFRKPPRKKKTGANRSEENRDIKKLSYKSIQYQTHT